MVWTKGGAPIDTSRVHVRTSNFDTVFFVRQAARSDSGEYELSVQIENMKDTATVHIRVVGGCAAHGQGGDGGGGDGGGDEDNGEGGSAEIGTRERGRWQWGQRGGKGSGEKPKITNGSDIF